MIRWTTPTLNIQINPRDIEIEKVILSLFDERNCKLLEFEIPQSEITDGAFTVTLTQEQSQMFAEKSSVVAQLNIINGDSRLATNKQILKVERNLHNKEIEL